MSSPIASLSCSTSHINFHVILPYHLLTSESSATADPMASKEAPTADQAASKEAPTADQAASKEAPTADPAAPKEASPSANDIIAWQTEYSIDFGHIGWSRNHPKAEFFTNNRDAAYGHASSSASGDLLAMMDAALNEEAAKQQCMLERMQYMEAHPERVKEAELEVDRRLLQAGKTQQDIKSYVDDEEVFRRKVEDLYNIEYPPPPRDGVDAYIEYGLADNRRLASIQLEIKGSLNEFLNDRKSHLARNKDIWEPLESIYYEGSPWRYKWKPQDKSVEVKEKWFPLETQHDYSVLTKKAAKAANLANAKFTPVLSQVLLVVSPNTHHTLTIFSGDQNRIP